MTASNHVLTGMIIASTVNNPVLALPLALMSHFALDGLPHYSDEKVVYTDFKFKLILGADAYIAALCLFLVLLLHPVHMWIIIAGGVLAASPDLMWLPDFIAALRNQPKPAYGPIRQFHHKVQWWTKPKGAYIEGIWFACAFLIAFTYTI